jgi:hypothetical protein
MPCHTNIVIIGYDVTVPYQIYSLLPYYHCVTLPYYHCVALLAHNIHTGVLYLPQAKCDERARALRGLAPRTAVTGLERVQQKLQKLQTSRDENNGGSGGCSGGGGGGGNDYRDEDGAGGKDDRYSSGSSSSGRSSSSSSSSKCDESVELYRAIIDATTETLAEEDCGDDSV